MVDNKCEGVNASSGTGSPSWSQISSIYIFLSFRLSVTNTRPQFSADLHQTWHATSP